MTRNEESLQALFSNTEIIKSSAGTIHCVYLSDITPAEWTKDMALAAIKNSVTNYGYYEYNGKKGLCIVGDFEDIYNFIESTGYVVDEDNLYHWKEFPWDNAKKLDTVRSSRKPIKSERVTNGGRFTDVMFELINELKLKKDYRITRPSWDNFDFDHKYRDGSFSIYINEKSQVVYGSVVGFGEHDNDVFKYETEKVNVDSYNLKRECRKIIIDCMNYLDNTIGIVSFE